MTDLPPELLAEIEADVERYRNVRITAARKRLTPEFLEKLERQREIASLNAAEIVNQFCGGDTTYKIAGRYKHVSRARIVGIIRSWVMDRTPLDADEFAWPGPFSERRWPAMIWHLPKKP